MVPEEWRVEWLGVVGCGEWDVCGGWRSVKWSVCVRMGKGWVYIYIFIFVRVQPSGMRPALSTKETASNTQRLELEVRVIKTYCS